MAINDEKILHYNNLLQGLSQYVDNALGFEPCHQILRSTRIESICQIIAASFSELLFDLYRKNNGNIILVEQFEQLITPGADEYLDMAIRQTGLSHNGFANIIRDYTNAEILDGVKLELPWGGYVKKVDSHYIICKYE